MTTGTLEVTSVEREAVIPSSEDSAGRRDPQTAAEGLKRMNAMLLLVPPPLMETLVLRAIILYIYLSLWGGGCHTCRSVLVGLRRQLVGVSSLLSYGTWDPTQVDNLTGSAFTH